MTDKLLLLSPTALHPVKLNIKNSKIGTLAKNFFILTTSDRILMLHIAKKLNNFQKIPFSHTFSMGLIGVKYIIIYGVVV